MLCNNADVRRCSYFELGLPVKGNYREGVLDRETLTEILNLRTLHPLCQFSPPQGTHREGYLAKAEWVETLTRFCEQPERRKCKLQGFSFWACEELNPSGKHRRRGPSCTSILPKVSSSFLNTMKSAIKWFTPSHPELKLATTVNKTRTLPARAPSMVAD